MSKRTEVKHFDADFDAQWADSKFEQAPTSPNENGRYSDEASKGHSIFWLWAEVWHASLFPYRFPFAKNLRSCTIMIKSIRVMVIWFWTRRKRNVVWKKTPKNLSCCKCTGCGSWVWRKDGATLQVGCLKAFICCLILFKPQTQKLLRSFWQECRWCLVLW